MYIYIYMYSHSHLFRTSNPRRWRPKFTEAFKAGGSTTAGNSSQVTDGAAMVLLARWDCGTFRWDFTVCFFFSAFILEDTRRTMTFWRRSLPKHGWFRVFLKVPCFFVSQTWFDPRVFSVMAVSMGRRINWLTFWGTLFCHRYPQEQNYHELGHPKLVECSGKKNINNWGKRKSWIVQYFAWYFSCHFFSVQYHLGLWLVRAFA